MSFLAGLSGLLAPAGQLVKGAAGFALNQDFEQTNKNFDPAVVDAIRAASARALEAGRKGTDYEDYDDLPDGTKIGELVRSDEARGNPIDFIKKMAYPQAQAAFSVGRGSIQVDDNGNVFFTDKYNFSRSSSNQGDDAYSQFRKLVGRTLTEDSGDTKGNTIKIYLGKEKELVGRKVNKGDTLSKIAKEEGFTVSELAKFNGIKNVNALKIGQRIKIPAQQPKEQTVELFADKSNVSDYIGA